jgi:hypothetical protein
MINFTRRERERERREEKRREGREGRENLWTQEMVEIGL